MNKQKIGLFFGSFNPIHTGHLIVANVMACNTDLQKVWFVVSPQNPFKQNQQLLHEFDRYDMVQAAISDNWKLAVNDIEFHLPKPSYTIHTLTHLQEKNPDKEFVLIMGEDNLNRFERWKNYDKILQYYSVYVYGREDDHAPSTLQHAHIKKVEAPLINISASYIRQCVKEKKSIRYLVPESVEQLISLKGYYL